MNRPNGILAMYPSTEALTSVMLRLRDAGLQNFEVFLPFPCDEVDALLPGKKSKIGWIMLFAGLVGCAGAFFLQWYACRDYPLNVGGRPINSWPAYIPVTFELTVLTAALTGVISLLIAARLPRLDYPTFASANFRRASQDRFFLCWRNHDRSPPSDRAREILRHGAESVEEIEL